MKMSEMRGGDMPFKLKSALWMLVFVVMAVQLAGCVYDRHGHRGHGGHHDHGRNHSELDIRIH